MNAQYLINLMEKAGIKITLDGDQLHVKSEDNLTKEDIHFLKTHKPELVEYLQSLPVLLIDEFGRRQCLSCDYWARARCNCPEHIGRDDWGRSFYYTPNSERWMRCEFHTLKNFDL